MRLEKIDAGPLRIAYATWGRETGWPCVLGHGFPYDIRAYAEVAPRLADAGARVVVPYLRGFGPTQFLSADTPRSGEQAALGADMLALMDALGLERAVLGGYDWGGRAACVIAALWPHRVEALVTGNSYNIQDIARSGTPAAPEVEASLWYQYYFHGERGRRGLEADRAGIARLLWRMWSPTWNFDDATFARSAAAFENPDFVDVVIHSYRHRYSLVPGDPAVAAIEAQLVRQPDVLVPTVAIDGARDGVNFGTRNHARKFKGPFVYKVFPNAGHNLPQEDPAAWAAAILEARGLANA